MCLMISYYMSDSIWDTRHIMMNKIEIRETRFISLNQPITVPSMNPHILVNTFHLEMLSDKEL